MRKPAAIRALYAELRQMLGDDVSSSDVLKIAHHFLRAYTDAPDEMAEFGVAEEGRPFATLPVDEAMNDGGWRVLNFEIRRQSSLTDRGDPLDLARLVPILNRYLGPEWRLNDWGRHGFYFSK